MTPAGISGPGPWPCRKLFYFCRLRGFALPRQRPRHRQVPASNHRCMAEGNLGLARDFLLARAHPVGIQHPPPHGIPLRRQHMPMNIVTLPSGLLLFMLNNDCPFRREAKFAGEIFHHLRCLLNRGCHFRSDFEMADGEFFPRRSGVIAHCRQVVGRSHQRENVLIGGSMENMTDKLLEIEGGATTTRGEAKMTD